MPNLSMFLFLFFVAADNLVFGVAFMLGGF